ncbi:E3 ubiquitin-protein ligase msl-2 [Drosophila rhopaloa]|uniref:E3 ubiquitin-protein ligase msl-2 n=1 Tax=Drosophila rhopaloa TaxID=1041015 RepID=A0A6P4F1B7_DRORH|nr:E3 ubiquitin-protein ligase msl-2 [Drosophila rhopaloa]
MLAQTVYLKMTRLSLRSASNLSKRRVDELNSGVGELRQLLSCVVCCQLLVDPYSPKGKRCQHNVCRLCLRGKKRLFPNCSQCEECSDFKTYEENRLMGIQLLCYKTLCVHLLQSSLFGQLAGLRPQVGRELVPRIKLPPMTTQEFIREGSNISDTGDTFLPQPDLPFLKDLPTSLPAETPPTTAATTPELPYDQHLNISDIEAEAAATAEQGHFSPIPLLPTGSRMGLLSHGGQMVIATESGFMEHPWTDQVDLSGAVSVSSFPSNSTNFAVSYVMPTAASTPFDPQELQIGQVVQMADSTQLAVLAAVEETVETSTQLAVVSTTIEEQEMVSTQLAVLSSVEEHNEICAQLDELPAEDSQESLETFEDHKESVESEALAEIVEHEEDNTQLAIQTSQSPLLAHMDEPEEEVVTHKRKLSQMQAEEQEEERLDKDLAELEAAAEEAAEEELLPNSVELQDEASADEAPLKRKRTRSLKASQAAKIEPAPAEVKAKMQSGKGAFRKFRGKEKEEKNKPTKPKCRCGVSGSANTLTTCRNSRCQCYTSGNSCAGCYCVCCKNPHKEDFVESDNDEDCEELQKEPEPMEQSEEIAAAKQEEKQRESAAPESSGDGISLVPLSNLQQSQHPLVLVQNENGEYQGFNIFQGNKPVDPATVGFMRVQLQNNDPNNSVPQYAYVMPPPAVPEPPVPSLSPQPPPVPERDVIEPPAKKYRTRTRRGMANFSALDTVDELVSGGSRSNSAAGDRLSATDNAHSLFEEIMSGSDDL